MNNGYPVADFSITSPLESLRLMEVPTEVLEVIKANRVNGSRGARLRFKSLPPPANVAPSSTTPSTKIKDGVLHLCSDEKIWAVRQVSTSNSVYIVQSSSHHGSSAIKEITSTEVVMGGTEEEQNTTASRGRVSAIAKVGDFLELLPMNVDEREVETMVTRLVPIFHHPAVEHDLQTPRSQPRVTRQALEDDIPAPTTIFTRSLARLSVFEHPHEHSKCYIPSPRAILHVWTQIVEGCTIESIPLDNQNRGLSISRIVNVLGDETDRAIATAMLSDGGMFDALGLTRMEASTTSQTQTFHPDKLSFFTAGLMLVCEMADIIQPNDTDDTGLYHPAPGPKPHNIPLTPFLMRWSNNLATSFLPTATKSNFQRVISTPVFRRAGVANLTLSQGGQEVITWSTQDLKHQVGVLGCGVSSYADLVTASVGADGSDGGVGSAAAAAGKRKWHEKFAAQRNKK